MVCSKPFLLVDLNLFAWVHMHPKHEKMEAMASDLGIGSLMNHGSHGWLNILGPF